MNRRGFLGSILALGVAPAIVRADSLMRIVPRELGIYTASGTWIRFTYDSNSGEAKFYESSDGARWMQIGAGVNTRGGIVQYYSTALQAPVSAYPPEIGDTDLRVCASFSANNWSVGRIGGPEIWTLERATP